jgi:hypothetical protein
VHDLTGHRLSSRIGRPAEDSAPPRSFNRPAGREDLIVARSGKGLGIPGTGHIGGKLAREIVEIPGRGHALTIDSGWREVAETALAFVKRFVPA